jgi:endonuclease/exonuclease/phosphatase family metal-dependent hydrolase
LGDQRSTGIRIRHRNHQLPRNRGRVALEYSEFPRFVVEDLVRLRRRIAAGGLPEKITDRNLIIGTWNVRAFGSIFSDWSENPGSPKRNLRALAILAEIIQRMDLVAIQEVRRETAGIRLLLDEFLGSDWGLLLSDVSAGVCGNNERLAFIYDRRRVIPSGLAGEIVLPPSSEGDPSVQFCRTPYLVGFQAGNEHFTLLSAHINYGKIPADRLPELTALAAYTANEIRDRSLAPDAEEKNLIVLGDMNIDHRGESPLFDAFVSTGLVVPEQILNLRSTYNTEAKHYDQIGWFMDEGFTLRFNERAGIVDFAGAVCQEMSNFLMSYRISDHFPLWVEFLIDRSVESMGGVLGLSDIQLAMPDPLSVVPN